MEEARIARDRDEFESFGAAELAASSEAGAA